MQRTFSPAAIQIALSAAVLALGAGIAATRATPVAAAQAPDPATPAFYTAKVKPIFETNCYRCHAGMNHRGGFQMDSQAALMKGGRDGVAVVPGDPAKSLLIKLIRHEAPSEDPGPMPPKSKLSDDDIATVTAWIKAGAKMPPD